MTTRVRSSITASYTMTMLLIKQGDIKMCSLEGGVDDVQVAVSPSLIDNNCSAIQIH